MEQGTFCFGRVFQGVSTTTSLPAHTVVTMPSNAPLGVAAIGAEVARDFGEENGGVFGGIVQSFDKKGGRLYCVKYSDGDAEDFDEDEYTYAWELANVEKGVLSAEDNGDEAKTLFPKAMEQLCHANYPGNVRQLENTLARAAAMSETAVIGIEDLEELTSASHPVVASPAVSNDTDEGAGSLDAATSLSAVAGDLEGHMDSIEREILQKAMTEYRWNKTAAAKALGVSFRSLRYRLKKLGLDD